MTDEFKQEEKEEQAIDWDALIKACNTRPKEMTVVEFCEQNGVTKANFYYHQRQHKKVEKNNKKRKSKKAAKETPVIKEPIVNEETIAMKESQVIEPVQEVAVQKPKETEAVQEVVEVEEIPAVESVAVNEEEATQGSITENTAQEPTVAKVPEPKKEAIAVQEPISTIDIIIGSSVIRVNDNTSPELLSRVIETIVSNMKKSDD